MAAQELEKISSEIDVLCNRLHEACGHESFLLEDALEVALVREGEAAGRWFEARSWKLDEILRRSEANSARADALLARYGVRL